MGRDYETAAPASTLGYDRAAVDAFLASAAEERQKLEDQIERSNLRLARARTALGTHRVMVAMLLETQRELSTIRRDAERQAAAIIAAAERDVREQQRVGTAVSSAPVSDPIDLRDLPATYAPSAEAAGDASPDDLFGSAADEERYFAYLRGALSDEEPLGPRSDEGGIR